MRFSGSILILFLILTGFFPSLSIAASNPHDLWSDLVRPTFSHLDQDRGLPGDTVFSFAQDRQGFVWIGTTNGLARYDGYHTHIFTPLGTPDSLPDSIVRALYADPDSDTLWVGTQVAGLARLDLRTQTFQPVVLQPRSVAASTVLALEGDGHGGVWVATRGGVGHVDTDGHLLSMDRHAADNPDSLPSDTVFSLHLDHAGRLWLGTERGLAVRDPASGRYALARTEPPVADDAAADQAFLRESFWEINEDDTGTLWLGSDHHGIARFVPDARTVGLGGLSPVLPAAGERLITTTVRGWTEIRPGVYWLATLGDGLVEVDAATTRYRVLTRDVGQPRSLSSNVLRAVLRDRSGLIWLGGDAGVDIHNPQMRAATTLFTASSSRNSPIPEALDALTTIKSMATTPTGSVWMGGEGRLIELSASHGVLHDIATGEIRHLSIVSLAQLPSGDLLIGSTTGLYRLIAPTGPQGKGGQPPRLHPLPFPAGPAAPYISDIIVHGDEAWIGSFSGMAHLRADGRLEAVSWGEHPLTDYIAAMAVGVDDTVFAGTHMGLLRRDPISGAITRIRHIPGIPTSLSQDYILSLAFDEQQRLWVGTAAGGVSILPPGQNGLAEPRFRTLGQSDGLPSLRINSLTYDGAGGMWSATPSGLVRINTGRLTSRTLGRDENASIHRYWENASARLPDGRLLFGGDGGFTLVDPAGMTDWTYTPPVVITRLAIDGEEQRQRTRNATQGGTVVLQPGHRMIEIAFSALDYSAPDRNRFAVRLKGFDRDWVETAPGTRQATYTNLPPGQYTFEVRGSNSHGVWSPYAARFTLQVLPAWYQSLWFLGAVALLLLVSIAGGITLLYWRQRRRQEELEKEVSQRTADLKSAVITLGQVADAGRDLVQTLDSTTICQSVERSIKAVLPIRDLRIAVITAETGRLGVIHAYPTETRDALEGGQDERQAASLLLSEVVAAANQTPPQTERDFVSPQGQRIIALALMVDQHPVGALSLTLATDAPVPQGVRDAIRSIAAFTAIALSNADSYSAAERARADADRALDSLRTAMDRLMQQEKLASLGNMVAVVSHEVNTPLGVSVTLGSQMEGEIEALSRTVAVQQLRRTDLDDFLTYARDGMDVLNRNLRRATVLLESFKRLSVDQASERADTVALVPYVRDALVGLTPLLRRRQVETNVRGPEDLTLATRPGALAQVLTNLVQNALTHAFDNTRFPRIDITIASSPTETAGARLIVADNGSGMNSEQLERAFEPFYTTKQGTGGSGLGLHIVHSLVTGPLGGSLALDSQPGHGTIFIIDLAAIVDGTGGGRKTTRVED